MNKPKVVTKSFLRKNLSSLTKKVTENMDEVVWVYDNKLDDVKVAIINADKLDLLEQEIKRLEHKNFIKETLKAERDFRRNPGESFTSVNELFEDLEDDKKNTKNKSI